jgi:4-aminobutyrate aminotransferase
MSHHLPKLPQIVTELPGPKAKAIIAKDHKFVSTSYTRGYPLVAEEALGAIVKDPDGNCFLDFAAGIAVVATGHCHPEVVKAVKDQADKLLHISGTDFYYTSQVQAAERVARHVPGKGTKRVFFGNSGAESIECAIKLAKYHTGRKRFIAFYGAFHGRTTGALALTASKAAQKERFFPLMDGVTHVPYGYCYRCPYGQTYGKCKMECVSFIEDTVFKTTVPPSEVAAIFVEPIQGEGGYVVPPVEFMQGLRKICDKHGILLVADEVQCGVGRTGKFAAMEHFGVQADITCIAKGIASGLPLSACVASDKIMDWAPGSHASTFGGNPLACAAAEVTMRLVDEELAANATSQGEFIMSRLKEMMATYEVIGDVRGKGLMIGVEFVKDRISKERNKELRDEVVEECFREGLLLLGAGYNTLRICPPLVVDREQVTVFLEILERSMKKAMKTLGYKGFPF